MTFSDIALRIATDARSSARRLGILRPLALARAKVFKLLGKDGYEIAFDDALKNAVREGDVVWDVGANVGLYTTQFSDRAGPAGSVCAFEPTPACFRALGEAVGGRANVRLFNLALGDAAGSLPMSIAVDQLGATHSLVSEQRNANRGATIEVKVARGDTLRENEALPCPNVIKIDVEGFEEEVIRGLDGILAMAECRAVLIEIHFGILEARGERHAPSRIKDALLSHGFKISWTDASHMAALKA